MAWRFFYKKSKWEPFSDQGNAAANAALSEDPPRPEFTWEHHWQNGYGANGGKWKNTWYNVDLRRMYQEQDEANDGNGTRRKIKGSWSEEPYAEFDFQTLVAQGPPGPPPAAAAPAPPGSNVVEAPPATNAPVRIISAPAPRENDPMFSNADPWAAGQNSQGKGGGDQNSQGKGGGEWQAEVDKGWWSRGADKTSNMAGEYGGWHSASEYGGWAHKDCYARSSDDGQPGPLCAEAPPPQVPDGQPSTHEAHARAPPRQVPDGQPSTHEAHAKAPPPQVPDGQPSTHEAHAKAPPPQLPDGQPSTHEAHAKAPPPNASPAKAPPPQAPHGKASPPGLNSSNGGNRWGHDDSTKTGGGPLPKDDKSSSSDAVRASSPATGPDAKEQELADLREQLCEMQRKMDATMRAVTQGSPVQLQ